MAPPRQRSGSATQPNAAPRAGAPERVALCDAQVRYELERWRGARLDETLRTEVAAALDWLETTKVSDVLPAAETADLAAGVLDRLEVTDELVALVVEAALAALDAVADSEATLVEVVDPDDAHDFVRVAVGMPGLRQRAIEALTDNAAYHELVAHVLYHGVKAFVLSENVVARKVPGASSLIKFGQRSLNSAVPGLEEGVDRRLQRFVQAQIGETLIESKRFIESYLTGEATHELIDALYASSGQAGLRELADVITGGDAEALTLAVAPLAEHVLRSGLIGNLAAPTIERVLTAYEDRMVTELLEAVGIDRESLLAHVTDALRPLATYAVASGYLEQRLRVRLEAFYADPVGGFRPGRLSTDEARQLALLLDKLVKGEPG